MASHGVFEFHDYKSFLRAAFKGKDSKWGSISEAAKAAGCQRSYLSRVIHGDAHLTADQAFRLSRSWRLSTLERRYWLTLIEAQKAGSREYREFLQETLERLRKENENLARKLSGKRPEMSAESLEYYSSWHWQAIHLLLAVPEFQDPHTLAFRLGLTLEFVEQSLRQLEKWKLAERKGDRWLFCGGNLHIPPESPLASLNHLLWRQRAVMNSQMQQSSGQSVHYTGLQAMSREAAKQIAKFARKMIEESDRVAGPSDSEEVHCMVVDFFKV